jgi:hypothetical protein
VAGVGLDQTTRDGHHLGVWSVLLCFGVGKGCKGASREGGSERVWRVCVGGGVCQPKGEGTHRCGRLCMGVVGE